MHPLFFRHENDMDMEANTSTDRHDTSVEKSRPPMSEVYVSWKKS